MEAAIIIFCIRCGKDFFVSNMSANAFKEAILCVNQNQKMKEKDFIIYKLIDAFKRLYVDAFVFAEWIAVIDGYGSIQDTDAMMDAYEHMVDRQMDANVRCLVILLQHLIKHGETQRVKSIWKANIDFNSMLLQSLIVCVDRSRHCHEKDILLRMCDLIVTQKNVEPNLHCFCLAILAFSKHDDAANQNMANKLLQKMENDAAKISLLDTNPLSFLQILSAYGNVGIGIFEHVSGAYSEFNIQRVDPKRISRFNADFCLIPTKL